MHRASWVFLLAIGLMLTAGCKKDELRAKDARIAELEEMTGDTSAKLDQCKKDRENLNKLVKGYTGEINAMEAALAEAAAREAQAAKRLAEYNSMLKQLKSMIDWVSSTFESSAARWSSSFPRPSSSPAAAPSSRRRASAFSLSSAPCWPSLEGRMFQVGGHTDNKPINTHASRRTGSFRAPARST